MAKGGLLAAQPTAEGLRAFYNFVCAPEGFKLASHMWPICMALMDRRIKKLMVIQPPGLGKSKLLSIVYPAHLLGIRPHEQILGISAGEALMQGFMESTGNIIETPTYKAIFPNVFTDKEKGWSRKMGINMKGRPQGTGDPSYFACGIDSSTLTGLHATTIILDDIHNASNSSNADQCEKIVKRWYDTIRGRANGQGCRFIMAGRRWHQEDIYGALGRTGEWVVMTLPAERVGTDKLWMDIEIPDGLECCFTEGKNQ